MKKRKTIANFNYVNRKIKTTTYKKLKLKKERKS